MDSAGDPMITSFRAQGRSDETAGAKSEASDQHHDILAD